ncbi:MAG: ribosomal protein [Patescibacteria group bacterium]|jgi:ribosomal protein L29|nr:ribosomal protein [Patescibacteria group bacterium]
MNTKEIKQKNTTELNALITEKEKALQAFRFGVAGSNVRNVKEGAVLKKDIARIKTFLRAQHNA